MSIGYAREEGTFTIPVSFTDEDDLAVTPNTITWSLSKTDGTIVNEREDVNVAVPGSTVNITLQGDDLAISDDEDVVRILTIEIDYDSSIGSGLPQNARDTFRIIPLSQIP